ncbi:hypothetical protein V1291_002489 [Nitrobacteraceae bacterium AZCC 1564]
MMTHQPPRSLVQKLMWFGALWLLGIGAVGLIAFILRLWIAPH